ncbi:MAG: hypothetical protein RLZZ34_791 [Verrucomicrobiota bacterium]
MDRRLFNDQPLDLPPRRGTGKGAGGTGSGTISEFDPTALQPSWTHKPADPRRVRCPPIQSWLGRSGKNGCSPRPSEAIGHYSPKPSMNATCGPVFESGDGCSRAILLVSSSGHRRSTRWRAGPVSRTCTGDASWRFIPRSRAVSATATHRPALNPTLHPPSEIVPRPLFLPPFPTPVSVS